jgi:phosphoenolpyruvate phosphomutase
MPSGKIVYTVVCADYFHAGHMNIIKQSAKLGKLIVGVMTDEAITSYKRTPMLPYEKRKEVVENIKGVWKVVPQHTLDYTDNLIKYKPDIVTNGDDWRTGTQKETRQKVIEVLKRWNGRLVEFPYTQGISSTKIISEIYKEGITPDDRRQRLKRLINTKQLVRVMEAHSGLSALIVENTKIDDKEYDAIWESSFTDSASKGKPDIELVDFTSRVHTINEILEVTTKPIIVDLDTGGQAQHFRYMVKTLERLGVSAVIIEDKRFPKINSLITGAKHVQEDIDIFCDKIQVGKNARVTEEFMIIARIESFIAGKGLNDAIIRAKAYIKAGADAILIHSKETSAHQIVKFAEVYNKFEKRVPLVIVPTTYETFREKEMKYYCINIVIYANQLLRASYSAMQDVADTILTFECSGIGDDYAKPKEIFDITNKGANNDKH